jgi:hypothetical protein
MNLNISSLINESFSCVNLTFSNSSSKDDGFDVSENPNVWADIITNQEYLNNFGVWMWADYNCSFTEWNFWEPDIYLRGCGVGVSNCTEALV